MARHRPLSDDDRSLIAPYYVPRPRGVIPETLIDASPTYCLKINQDWLQHVLGMVFALAEPDSWIGNFEEVEFARSEIRRLIASIAPCEDPPMPLCFVGMIIEYWFDEDLPDYCLPFDGGIYDRVDYPELYARLGTGGYTGEFAIISADQFKLPNDAGRAHVGEGNGQLNAAWYTGTLGLNYEVGQTGGEEKHALSAGENASHTHLVDTATHTGTGNNKIAESSRVVASTAYAQISTSVQGAGNPHENRMPFIVSKFAIVAKVCEVTVSANPFKLRQNPDDDCEMEQSFNNGATWSPAFDYSLCKPSSLAGNLTVMNEVNNLTTIINNLVDQYDGSAESIDPDLVYGDSDDDNRDAALCFAILLFVGWCTEATTEAFKQANESEENFFDGFGNLLAGAGAGLAALAPALLIWGVPVAPMLAIAGVLFKSLPFINQIGNDIFGGTPQFSDETIEAISCCMTGNMSGDTISFAGFQLALSGCTWATDEEQALADIIALILPDIHTFVSFIKMLADIIPAAIDGVALPCACNPADCLDVDFRIAGSASPFVPIGDCAFVSTVGVIGNSNHGTGSTVAGDSAGVELVWSEPVIVTSIRVKWRRARTAGTGATGLSLSVVDVTGGGYVQLGSVGPIGTAGVTEDYTFTVTQAMDTLRVYALGSKFNLKIGLIYEIEVCWQGAGEPT